MAKGNTYADPRFGASVALPLNESGAINGTNAAVGELGRYTLMEDSRLLDWNVRVKVGGTAAQQSILIGYSLGGTGAFTALGTAALGTNADSTVIDGSLTETDLAAGDDVVYQRSAGTSAAVHNVQPVVQLRERFVQA